MADAKEKCGICSKTQDEDKGCEEWTECTKCKQWFHNDCAGIEETIPNDMEWLCETCKSNKSKSKNGENNENTWHSAIVLSDEEDEADRMQLSLMTKLIKEKEELCALKQKQLDMMERLSQKKKSDNTETWVQSNPKYGESSKSANANLTREKVNRDVRSVTMRKKCDMMTMNNKSVSKKMDVVADDEIKDDLAGILKRQMQLMSQHHLAELPEFDGDPDIWPIFYQQFIATTEQGGFDDSYNLMRLRKCLKGEARQSVAGIMS